MNRKMRLILIFISGIVMLTSLTGCAGLQTRTKSSVMDYLYPKTDDAIARPDIPELNIPVRVGIAFVPEHGSRYGVHSGALTEQKKSELLEKVAANFRKYEFVGDIQVIPTAYLTVGGSFSNLEQIKTMYQVDIMALVSYDQVQFTDEGLLSLTYWTIVGAYVISGEKNDTSTMLDTVVIDIQSRKMLFRAPGTSNIKGRSTLINLSEELRADSLTSFAEATDEMIVNLDAQLSSFKEKIKNKPEQVKINYSAGYSGGGGALQVQDIILLVLFSLLLILRKRMAQRKRVC